MCRRVICPVDIEITKRVNWWWSWHISELKPSSVRLPIWPDSNWIFCQPRNNLLHKKNPMIQLWESPREEWKEAVLITKCCAFWGKLKTLNLRRPSRLSTLQEKLVLPVITNGRVFCAQNAIQSSFGFGCPISKSSFRQQWLIFIQWLPPQNSWTAFIRWHRCFIDFVASVIMISSKRQLFQAVPAAWRSLCSRMRT